MLKTEIHIVLIWEKGLNKLDCILYDLKNSFEILDVIKVEWNKDSFSNNLSRFYGEKLPNRSFKEKHCGKGAFIAIIVRQNNPKYKQRETSKGNCLVNSCLFDKKQLYRNWTGGGHKIHTSNDMLEAAHDILFLFNKDINEYQEVDCWSGVIHDLNKDIEGCDGWTDFESFFTFINKSSKYLILRNYKDINLISSNQSDIDFLTSDKNFKYHINGLKKNSYADRVVYSVKIGDQDYNVDIRTTDDGYYDSNWAKDIISQRIMYESKFFIPGPINEFYSLLYHSLIHKNNLTNKYIDELSVLAKVIDVDIDLSIFASREHSLSLLEDFMSAKNYEITRPKDFSVQYNYSYKGLKRIIWEFIGRIKNG